MLNTIAVILLVPYFAWGIYALRLKYRFHEDLSLLTEAGTLLGLMLFYVVEVTLLREALDASRIQFMVATLGLITSGAALYGHMAISFSSRLIVEAVVPGPNMNDGKPRLGPAEALERQKDYAGALQEYYVIARMFPRDHAVCARIAHLHEHLGQYEDALHWLERAQKWADTEDRALTTTTRQANLLDQRLRRPDSARAVLTAFLEKYPKSKEAPALRARMETVGFDASKGRAESLSALDEAPLMEPAPAVKRAAPARKKSKTQESSLSALDDAPVMSEGFDAHQIDARPNDAPASALGIEILDIIAPTEADEAPRTGTPITLGLDLMETAPTDTPETLDTPQENETRP
jgi:tetratricopeptide (TPR) repeat protein